MRKNHFLDKSSETAKSLAAASADAEVTFVPFWLLNVGIAKKLGQRSNGILNYHVVADNDRRYLLIAVTKNEGGGYFSRERVPFRTILKYLDKYKSGVPFVSKVLKDVFVSKSANNAGFLCAVLHALGLLTAAPKAHTQHIVIGDWLAWEKATLAETGSRIELPTEISGKNPVYGNAEVGREQKQTFEIPSKKLQ